MDWITRIQRALDYTEAHLTEKIDYEEVAKQAYSSSFHFQRVFSMLCGFSLGDYIRMRRLTLAAEDLMLTGDKTSRLSTATIPPRASHARFFGFTELLQPKHAAAKPSNLSSDYP